MTVSATKIVPALAIADIADADVATASQAVIEATGADELNLLVPRNKAAAPFLALLARLDAAGVPLRLVTVERAEEVSP